MISKIMLIKSSFSKINFVMSCKSLGLRVVEYIIYYKVLFNYILCNEQDGNDYKNNKVNN
jgi:hypothetical protein